MNIALFGRDINEQDFDRLSDFFIVLRRYAETKGNVGILYHTKFYNYLKNKGIDMPNGSCFNCTEDLPKETSLFISLGGDGTFLESLTLIRERNIPVAGVNFGRLGFLTNSCNNFECLLQRQFSIETRTILKFENDTIPNDFYPYALNEITIQRITPSMLEMNLSVNGNTLPTYWADGILIATATGSTAYSLSIGGPVAMPQSKVVIISPIAPHNLNVRPLIVPESSDIRMTFGGRSDVAILTADNRSFSIKAGAEVKVSKAEFELRCATVNDNFIEALNQKLLWGEDKRNKN